MELILLGVVASVSLLSYALWRRSHDRDPPPALPAAPAPRARLRGGEAELTALRPGDVVSHLRTDWLVEGALRLDDDGRASTLYRLADGARSRFLYVRSGARDPFLLDVLAPPETAAWETADAAAGPDRLQVAGTPFRLTARGAARVTREGSAPEARGERAHVYDYEGPGERALLVVAWLAAPSEAGGARETARADCFAGERVAEGLLELLPGS